MRSRRLLLSLCTTMGIGASAASCSLLVDVNADACAVASDCKVPGQICSQAAGKPAICAPAACKAQADCAAGSACTSGSCVPAAATDCLTNATCLAKGEHTICRKDTHKCVNLITPACTTIVGDAADDNAFFIGSILPTTGPDVSAGQPTEDGIVLALDEFDQNANGLPPVPGSTQRRPYVLIGCSDNSDDATAIAAAKHLAEEVGVAAIVGGAFSGTTIKLATTVTINDKVLLFSPSSTSASITTLDDQGLVWRTAPSDNLQASALALYMPAVEAEIKKNAMITSIKAVMLNRGDAYGSGLATTLEASLKINGMLATDQSGSYKRFDYGNPDDATADPLKYSTTVSQVISFLPHVILIFGGNEGITDILSSIEAQWPVTAAYRPRYVFSDGGEVDSLWNYVKSNDGLRVRITGTAPGAGADDPLFKAFHSGFLAKFPTGSPDVFGAAGAYDIAYLLAYAAGGLGAQPITGPNLALQLTKMSSGPAVEAGGDINAGFTKVSAGSIDFSGASGPLDFDPKTGEARSDIQIWCLPSDGQGNAVSGKNSGLYYDVKTAALVGAISATTCK